MFFFEKKNQKTFMTPPVAMDGVREVFLLLFLQKKKALPSC